MRYLLTLVLAVLTFSMAQATDFQERYANQAYSDYKLSLESAKRLKVAIENLLAETTEENLTVAKSVWTEARKDYSITEIYRFYGGPIDDENGPEGLLNAWPLDEVYIDYVKGHPNSGIINQVSDYPEITKELLVELNENDGEKNISTGWHAIEFLLWGQDFNDDGPGDRPISDFIVGKGQNAERRRDYLEVATDLLVEHLNYVVGRWDPLAKDSYHSDFVALTEKQALTNAFTSLVSMSSDELAIERMFVAYDTQFQEDEHSCFSDTTHFDLLYNFLGIMRVWDLIDESFDFEATTLGSISTGSTLLRDELTNFKGPFDQAIFDLEGRAQILLIVDQLQLLGDSFKTSATELGVKL